MKKIVLIQHTAFINGRGGTEKICSFLANHFCSLGYDVEVATNENIQGKEVYPLNNKIKLVNIYYPDIKQITLNPIYSYKGKNPFLWLKYKFQKKKAKFLNKTILNKVGGEDELYKFNLRQRANAWKKYIEITNPDLIITMSIGSLLEITFENEYDIPIINSTNGRPDHDYTDVLWYRSDIDMQMLKDSFKKLDVTQILFNDYKDFLPETFKGKCIHIGNPIPQLEQKEIVNHLLEKDKNIILHIGSLVLTHKQQDILIRAFAKIADKYPNWDLHFWGTGRDENTIGKLISNLKLQNRVFLNGFTDNPMEKLKNADIFVFPSRHEGFPLALGEAMSAGLPSIGLSYCCGINQMIINGENGFLAENEDELEIYLKQLIENKKLRKEMGLKAHQMMKNFAPDKIKKQWEELVSKVINGSKK